MAADEARLLVRVEATQAKMEKQMAAIAKNAARQAKAAEDSFKSANDNIGRGFQRSEKQVVQSLGAQRAAVSNLSFQLNDIAMGLASGTSPFTIMVQQGSQVSQALQGSGGLVGAVKTLGGAFTQMVNPVSLASFAIIGLAGVAVQYFTGLLSNSSKAEETLKEQAKLIDKVAEKWGDALPALKKYNDERKKLEDENDIKTAVEAVAQGEYEPVRKLIKDIRGEIGSLVVDLQQAGAEDTDVLKLQKSFNVLFQQVQDGKADTDQLRTVQENLAKIFRATGIPAADAMAKSIGTIADELDRAIEAADSARFQASIRDFFQRSPLGGLEPLTSGGGKFLNLQEAMDRRAASTPSQFEERLEKASGAIDGFVDRVIKAESNGRNDAKNPDSTATGAGQFIESTWLNLFRKYYPERAADMGKSAILELRKDADVSRSLIRAYARENAAVLERAGITASETALQLAHFLGAADAVKVLGASRGTPLAGLISAASIKANPTILGGGRTVDDAISYAENRSNASTSSETKRKPRTPDDIFKGSVEQIQKRIDVLNAEYEAQSKLNPLITDYGYAVEKAKIEAQLLAEAQKAGLEITPELSAKIGTLAENYAKASSAGEALTAKNQDLAQSMQAASAFGKDVMGGFISDLKAGKSASEALSNALSKVADKLLEVSFNALFDGSKAGSGGGLLGGIFGSIGKLLGFADGGYTGSGSRNQPAGVVHKGEYVFDKRATDRIGVRNLARLQKGYANGGYVGGMTPRINAPSVPQTSQQAQGGIAGVRVFVDEDGNWQAKVMGIARQEAAGVTRNGLSQYDKQMNRTFGSRMANAQGRQL